MTAGDPREPAVGGPRETVATARLPGEQARLLGSRDCRALAARRCSLTFREVDRQEVLLTFRS